VLCWIFAVLVLSSDLKKGVEKLRIEKIISGPRSSFLLNETLTKVTITSWFIKEQQEFAKELVEDFEIDVIVLDS